MSILITLFTFTRISAQNEYNLGARNLSLAGSTITIADSWSTLNNVGAIGMVTNSTASFTYQNRYNIEEFMVLGASGVLTTSWINGGVGFYRFGNQLYSEQKMNIALGHRIQMISLGAGLNLIQHHIEGLGSWNYWALEFGGVAQLTDNFFIGTHIFNIKVDPLLPIIMKMGISYRPIKSLMINLESEKSLQASARIRSGIEYQIIHPVILRTGFATNPFSHSFGMGLRIRFLNLNYGISNQTNIGSVQEFSLVFRPTRK